ncbi:MAG: GntG family PLP-dependent aldolase [Flavisolibacter sp.]
MLIDFRSDTVTRPSMAMKEAMVKAPLGDDVFGEDPSVNQLEELAAGMFGMEAAIFCPSGTMTNQIAIKCHTQPGEEVICDVSAHIYQYEGGGISFNSGASVKLIQGDRGRVKAKQVSDSINPDDIHKAPTRLVSLENTSNRGGGSCYEMAEIKAIREVCDLNHLRLHLDGARLFNALVAKNQSAKEYGQVFDTISICLSKSLGCPVGSLLLGKKQLIKQARRVRKLFGGAMRQAGLLAAAGSFALNNNIDRLKIDHEHAKILGNALSNTSFVSAIFPVETNIIIFELKPPWTSKKLTEFLKENSILVHPLSQTQIRLVTHLDISAEMVEKTMNTFKTL